MANKIDMEHFYEFKTDNGYIIDYEKIRNSSLEEMLAFLNVRNSISCKLFYPLFSNYMIKVNYLSSDELLLISKCLYNVNIDYSGIDKKYLAYNVAKCEAAREEIAYYVNKYSNNIVKVR